MANGHGGRRPGAGQKKKITEEQQARNRELVMATITRDDLLSMTKTAITNAIAGDPASRNWVTSFVLGNPADKLDVSVSGSMSVTGLREALGVAHDA